jgi:hypothetical protein
MRVSFLLSLATSLILPFLTCAQNQPQTQVTHFKNLPARVYFFDDATVRTTSSLTQAFSQPLISLLRTMMSFKESYSYQVTRGKTGPAQMIYHKVMLLCS